ncbi:hypothetical protein GLOIN_2v1535567 [Rhizophagus irregularis DAOM 181602=DAOM 197198]|nr:hypothetical protein GLOIN_2v1535567 [Rhizophagus irregularis DAOM 181602=DAOM 197198]
MDCGNKIINVRDALTNGNNERPTAHRSRVLIRIRVRSGYGLDRSGRKWEFRKIIMNDQGSKTSNDLINATKKYRRANDQDDPRELKRSYISEIKDKEFKTSGRHVYRKDLGGLYNICSDYCYEVFDTLINLVKSNVKQESWKH